MTCPPTRADGSIGCAATEVALKQIQISKPTSDAASPVARLEETNLALIVATLLGEGLRNRHWRLSFNMTDPERFVERNGIRHLPPGELSC
jgi:hypothetical protein